MNRRSRSSGRWLQEHFSDPYVQRAQARGLALAGGLQARGDRPARAAAAARGRSCLDLGAAPGAWSQYARRKVGATGRVIASDILPMDPSCRGWSSCRATSARSRCFEQLLALLPGARRSISLLSDMAPNLSGMDVIDQPRAMYLAELALDMAGRVLKPGGGALIKVFQGAGFQELVSGARGRFGRVRLLKPQASRARSPEIYLLAMQFRLV